MFESIKSIRPYFHSLREIENNVSLDIKLPLNWKFEEIIKPYRSVVIKIQDKNEKFTLLSLIAANIQEGYNVVFACANEIITLNKEEEEKQRLFQQKVKELQELFKKQSLDKLKEINFVDNYGQEDTTGIRMAEQRDEQGPEGDSGLQEEDD